MSKADKRKIEELREEVRRQQGIVSGWQTSYFGLEETTKKLRGEVQQEKEKYARLLERYIVTMERTVGLNEQRED
jgi:hypothetical protein